MPIKLRHTIQSKFDFQFHKLESSFHSGTSLKYYFFSPYNYDGICVPFKFTKKNRLYDFKNRFFCFYDDSENQFLKSFVRF